MIRQQLWAKQRPGLCSLPCYYLSNFTQLSTRSRPVLATHFVQARDYSGAFSHEHTISSFAANHRFSEDFLTSIDFDAHNYTDGRWLRNDQKERDMRYIAFNFDALCGKILKLCPGAGSIANCEKIEGGFNRSSTGVMSPQTP